ncbi:MAG: hypothetical protein JST00_01190 [Deltaproteobacteria bacterium]|nr:hypothetical protein [Deltaproteobacteria bacterium]
MRSILVTILVGSLGVLVLPACDESVDDAFQRKNRTTGDGADPSTTPADPTQPGACETGAAHVGFAGHDFVADRAVGGLGVDRRRIKPFSAMESEMKRALGAAPASLSASSAAFGDVPARWYAEPVAGAVSLYTTYSIAFTGCYDQMADAKYATAPTAASASAECATMQKKAWQRTPTPAETQACADLAVTKLASQEPRRRWAHACASVLTAAGFTSY